MKDYLAKKSVGFYLTVIAALAALIGLVNYISASGATLNVMILTGAALVMEILMIIGMAAFGNRLVLNLFPTAAAVLMAAAVAFSFQTQVDGLGFLISGMYSFNDLKNFLIFAICGLIAAVLYVISSFMDMEKKM